MACAASGIFERSNISQYFFGARGSLSSPPVNHGDRCNAQRDFEQKRGLEDSLRSEQGNTRPFEIESLLKDRAR